MKRTVKDTEIDERVGALLDMSAAQVGDVTHAFFNEVMEHLLAGNEVYITRFGTFKVSVRKGKRAAQTMLKASPPCGKKSHEKIVVEVKRKFYVSFRRGKHFVARFLAKYGKNKVVSHE